MNRSVLRARGLAWPAAILLLVAAFAGPVSPTPEPGAAGAWPEPEPAADPSLRATFTWTGNAASDRWDAAANWLAVGGLGYPDDCGDDASIFSVETPYQGVDLITEEIDDLTLSGGIAFHAAEVYASLTLDSVTLIGPFDITFEAVTVATVPSCMP